MTTTNDKINVVGKSAKDLVAHYDMINKKYALGMPALKGDETYKDLQTLVGEAQSAMELKQGDDGKDGKTVGAEDSGDKEYVFLKTPSYVDEAGTKRIAGGLYHINLNEYPRLRKMSKTDCTNYGSEVPSRALNDLAKWFGVSTTDKATKKELTDAQLLEKLVTEPTLY